MLSTKAVTDQCAGALTLALTRAITRLLPSKIIPFATPICGGADICEV